MTHHILSKSRHRYFQGR